MELKELETKKENLIEKVENWVVYGEQGEAQKALILKLIKGTETTDPDFAQALEDETAEEIIQLDLDCYDLENFVVWLTKHDFDLFVDYRFAETMEIEDAINEIDETQEEPSYCYDFKVDEFNKCETRKDKANYIKSHFDGLLYSEKVLVISW